MTAPPPVSVVLATFNRHENLRVLLGHLAGQTLPADQFEVIVVDDGSQSPFEGSGEQLGMPGRLKVLRQANAGAAAARHRGILEARGSILVIIDDDMQVPREFLAAHLARHPPGSRRVVIGRIRAAPALGQMPLFERFHARLLARWVRTRLHGNALCTGNVSLRRADYLEVGGFDRSLERAEDMDLGLRLEQAGVEVTFAEEAFTVHHSDHRDFSVWRRRAFLYGRCDLRVAGKHPRLAYADPWRFLFGNALTKRPFVLAALALPRVGRALAGLVLGGALAADRIGLESLAVMATSLLWDLEYFMGVRQEAGGFRNAVRSCADFLRKAEGSDEPMPGAGKVGRALVGALARARGTGEGDHRRSVGNERTGERRVAASPPSIGRYDDAQERDEILRFRRWFYGPSSFQADPRFLEWAYAAGKPRLESHPLWTARDSSLLVGQAGGIATAVRILGEDKRVLWIVDLAVAPAARGRGVASRLLREAAGEADLLAAVDVAREAQPLFLRSGWSLLGTLPLWVRLLDGRAFLSRRIGSAAARGAGFVLDAALRAAERTERAPSRDLEWLEVPCFDDRVDAIWRECASSFSVIARRDARWLTWRFDRFPWPDRYRRFLLLERGAPLGYAVLRLGPHNGIESGHLVDFLCPPRVVSALLERVVATCREWGASAVYCLHAGQRFRSAFARHAFLPRKSGFAVMVCTSGLDPRHAAPARDLRHWYLTAADSNVDRPREGTRYVGEDEGESFDAPLDERPRAPEPDRAVPFK
jgi:GT2 family glycosyltransferase/GNAT superfamily N-acetyltransferase